MKDKEFDSILKSKLEGKQSSLNPDHWSKMESSLDQLFPEEELEEKAFDQEISDKLKQVNTSYKESHWLSLEKRMAISNAMKTQIFVTKISEISIILLLIFTFFNLHLDQKYNQRTIAEDYATHESEGDLNSHFNSDNILATASLPNYFEKNNSEFSVETSSINEPEPFEVVKPVISEQLFQEKLIINSNQNSLKKPDEIVNRDNTLASITQTPTIKPLLIENKFNVDLPSIANSKITPLKDKTKKSVWYLNAYASTDINFINSPFDKIFVAPAYTIQSLGSSAGISISNKRGKVEIEAGLAYSTKSYTPGLTEEKIVYFAEGSATNTFDHILFNILSVPLNLKIHHLESEKWSFFSSLGITSNLIINAHYDRSKSFLPAPTNTGQRTYESKFDDKVFSDGILKGGSLNDNFYLSTNVGVGVQYNPLEQLGIFFQPNYNLHVLSGGVGPNEDKLYGLSLQAGLKYVIN